MGVLRRLEVVDTEMGSCLPTHVVELIDSELFSVTQIDSKSKTARILKNLYSSGTVMPNIESFSNTVSFNLYAEFGNFFSDIFTTNWQMTSQTGMLAGKFVTTFTAEAIENSIEVLRVTDVILINQKCNSSGMFIDTAS